MQNPIVDMMKAIAPAIPKNKPNNAVAQFISDMMENELKLSEDGELLKQIAINIANDDPNRVIDVLVKVYNATGKFITALNVAQTIDEAIPDEDPGPAGEPELDDSIDDIDDDDIDPPEDPDEEQIEDDPAVLELP